MRNKSARVVLVATAGAPVLELAAPLEVFGRDRTDLTPDWYDVELVTADGTATTIGAGLTAPGGRGLAALDGAGTVVVPACADVHAAAPDELCAALRSAHEAGARIVALCSGAFVLAQAGLLDGRRAATHWMHADELARRYPAVRVDADSLYVREGTIWTSAGSAAALDACLEIVRTDHGRAVAGEVARRIVTPPHRDGGQAQYIRYARETGIGASVHVTDWARQHLARASVAAMARQAGVSQRTLIRRFHEATGASPQAWLLRERLAAAQELLEAGTLTVDVIAQRVGLGTAANLRARFTAAFGVAPARYRATFSTRSGN